MSAGSTVGITTCTAGQSGGFVYQGTTSKQLYVNFIGATTFTTVKATSGNGGVFAILQTSYIANIQATSPVFTGSASGGKGGVFYFKGTDFTFTGTSVTFTNSQSTGGYGGVFAIENQAAGVTDISLTTSTLNTASASTNGGILYC